MKKFRVIFMGTPEFAVPCLAALYEHCDVIGVVTQPDKPRGRGQKLVPSPVKAWAEAHGLPVWQPKRIKEEDFTAFLEEQKPDLMVVVAFGQILSQRILDIPPYGCINVHGSLLPRYRGAAPMQWCVIDGEKKTGITTMFMDAGLDTGDMLLKAEFPIGPDTTLEEVHDGLMALGAKVLIDTLEELSAGTLKRIPQTGESNYAPMLTKETGHIHWQDCAQKIHNLVRGLDSWPGAYTFLAGKKYKIWRTRCTTEKTEAQPGTILRADKKEGLFVAAGDGVLEITELQAPGKKRMAAKDYLNGHAIALPATFED
ncbi:MAG: methionyl-tRNA formyltransferase [Mitsuokella jalaludinii]|uniref:methionyl-tRNA formyltransferase n=1 Tax=Mitsuokella TaxID=52225 RepID=UPI002432E3BC|nr:MULTISPECIES: methionyl-tRNA formyltransferase [Mitsuokella]MCI7064505.1 methionyl-tRNA formyltransferase [Mitsuokella jalaludinii]MCI7186398.1 methionyl-tRNA formyltransferase [Mitsuokella jalaludinii]MCI7716440.1 methionyl-tRNA formyltransferase [Mitsuokella jalaludinii]MDD7744640.1 methionyl-tRNA formyltransferase [Mitsuokella jalaludinii]MDY5364738.1 methionyl-tRNA formyltransferase [Mitsuokella jalaludinii]